LIFSFKISYKSIDIKYVNSKYYVIKWTKFNWNTLITNSTIVATYMFLSHYDNYDNNYRVIADSMQC